MCMRIQGYWNTSKLTNTRSHYQQDNEGNYGWRASGEWDTNTTETLNWHWSSMEKGRQLGFPLSLLLLFPICWAQPGTSERLSPSDPAQSFQLREHRGGQRREVYWWVWRQMKNRLLTWCHFNYTRIKVFVFVVN